MKPTRKRRAAASFLDPIGGRPPRGGLGALSVRRWIIGLLCGLSLAVGGCSFVRLGYNQAHELAYWWLDRHVDFDPAQTPRVREVLGRWFAWHRREQLPDYTRLLARAQAEVLAPVTAQQLCVWYDEGRSRGQVAFEHAVAAVVEIALTLTPQQIENIERRHAKVNAEYREETLQAEPQKRLKAAFKRAVDRAEMLYGKLDAAQRERLGQGLAQSPFDPERAYAQRRRSQQEAVQILRQFARDGAAADAQAPLTPAARSSAQDALTAYAQRLQRPADPDERRHFEQVVQYNCGMVAALHNSTTPEQRRHAAEKLADWNADVRVLIAEARR